MKFKITKSDISKMTDFFSKDKSEFIELNLEPVDQTLTQAVYEQSIRKEAYHQGYHAGYREGYYDRKRIERCGCGCNGNNCSTRFCDEYCWMYNK